MTNEKAKAETTTMKDEKKEDIEKLSFRVLTVKPETNTMNYRVIKKFIVDVSITEE